MLNFVEKYKYDIFSANGEDGLITECNKRIPLIKVACEFGADNGFFCSNTANLTMEKFLFDINPSGSVLYANITPENVNETIPKKIGVLSIDIDGNDYNVWKAYTGLAEIVIIEINSSLDPLEYHISLEKGSSYISMVELGLCKGYFLLCHTGNLIFVLDKYKYLFPEINKDPIIDYKDYFNTFWIDNAN